MSSFDNFKHDEHPRMGDTLTLNTNGIDFVNVILEPAGDTVTSPYKVTHGGELPDGSVWMNFGDCCGWTKPGFELKEFSRDLFVCMSVPAGTERR